MRAIKIETQKHGMKDIWEKQHMATSSFRGAHSGYLSLILQKGDVKRAGHEAGDAAVPLLSDSEEVRRAACPVKPSQACLLAL